MNPEILSLVRQHFPAIVEKNLQEEIATVSQLLHFEGGQMLMNFGAYIKIVPLVISGSIKVVREDDKGTGELFLYYLNGGETCSMSFSCCMMNKKSVIRTTTEEATVLIGIPIKDVDAWMMQYQSWKNFVMLSYDKRQEALIRTIDEIAFLSMDERLLNYLRKKATSTQSNTLLVTHQHIAYDLNASREAVSRLLKKLEKTGKLRLGRNKIKLL